MAPFVGYVPPLQRGRRKLKWAIGLLTLGVFVLVIAGPLRWGLSSLNVNIFPSARDDLIAWVPGDADAIEGANLKELRNDSRLPRELTEVWTHNVPQFDADAIDEIVCVDPVLPPLMSGPIADLYIVRLNSTDALTKAFGKGGWSERRKDGQAYYKGIVSLYLFRASPTIVLLSSSESRLLDAMSGGGDTWHIKKDLATAIRSTDGPTWGAAVGPAAQSGVSPLTRTLALFAMNYRRDAQPLRLSEYYSTKLSGSGKETSICQVFSSDQNAVTAKRLLERSFDDLLARTGAEDQRNPNVYLLRVIHDSLRITVSGKRLEIRYTVSHEDLKR
jgi:hypothetical protein